MLTPSLSKSFLNSSSASKSSISNKEVAYKTWLIENEVATDKDDLFVFDQVEHDKLLEAKPWSSPLVVDYFKFVKISAVALLKMVTHSQSGGKIEIMGLINGKIIGDTFIVMDSFALPVEGTETRVNAGAQANEFMILFQEYSEKVGKSECICGWYHSHPGYGCWLSGIDVETQRLYQQHQDPFLAIVIDPIKTCSAGRVEIGAFRCYPTNYVPQEQESLEVQQIPLDKVEDFGLHWRQYYSLSIEIFKSKLDTKVLNYLWDNYWVSVLSNAPLFTKRSFYSKCIADIAGKAQKCATNIEFLNDNGIYHDLNNFIKTMNNQKKKDQLYNIAKQSLSVAADQLQGVSHHLLQELLLVSIYEEDKKKKENVIMDEHEKNIEK